MEVTSKNWDLAITHQTKRCISDCTPEVAHDRAWRAEERLNGLKLGENSVTTFSRNLPCAKYPLRITTVCDEECAATGLARGIDVE